MQILREVDDSEFEEIMKMPDEEIIDRIKESGLSGRGGAGFPTGAKWEYTKKADGKSVLVCNADEGEPGIFKDRFIMENNLKALVQGMAIGQKVMDADCFLYLRGEYPHLKERIQKAAEEMGLELEIVIGAGAYICGEETALLNSIEGKAGDPRCKPPYPTNKGLFGRPTCVNNVETLANIPLLLTDESWGKELRLFSVSGNVERPGVYELPLGTRLEDILNKAGAEKPKAVLLGYSGGVIKYEKLKDMEVTDENFKEEYLMLGTCSMIVLNEGRSIPEALGNVSRFFVHESCGRCVPCREGGFRMLKILEKINSGEGTLEELDELEELADYIDISFCPLGSGYGFAVKSAIQNFREEFEERCR